MALLEENQLNRSKQSNCTIVTCYYKFPSKHSYEEYDKWMTNFLTTIETPMVIFTDDESIEKIRQLRKWAEQNTVIINRPLQDTYCAQEKYMNYWMKDWQRDYERHIHNPKLYIVWNEKSKFVEEVIENNYFNTDYYCWCDIGCFRTSTNIEKYKKFPNIEKIEQTNSKDKIQLLNIESFNQREIDYVKKIKLDEAPIRNIFQLQHRIGGTIFIGHISAWKKWIPTFYTMIETFMINNTFTGKDQDIMAMITLLYPDIVNLIKPPTNNDWFYLQDYFI